MLHTNDFSEEILTQIPPITDELGSAWEQPDPKNIVIIHEQAIMSRSDFDKLHQYDASIPSAVYVGKMWKCAAKGGGYLLKWWGPSDRGEDYCQLHAKLIIIKSGVK